MAAAAPAVASPQELVEREAAEALASDFWERIVSHALDVRLETSSSSSSLSSSSGSPLRVRTPLYLFILFYFRFSYLFF
jgi:hypothetical protein